MTAPDLASTIFLPPTDTVRAWQERDALQPTVDWAEMMHEEHAVAFTVAKIARVDLLIKVRESLDSVIRDGGTFEQWKANILPELQKAGWWGVVQDKSLTGTDDAIVVNDRRLRNIYRTNIRMSIAAGRWRKYQREKDLFPYLRYLSDHYRKHPRLNHQSWHGIILPVDHPAWSWLFPPNGWGCNCRVEQVSEARMRRKGWKVSEAPTPDTFPFTRPDGSTIEVQKGVQPGFSYNPGTAHLTALADRVATTAMQARSVGLQKAAASVEQAFTDDVRDLMLATSPPPTNVRAVVERALAEPTHKSEAHYADLELTLPTRFYRARRIATADAVRHIINRHGVGGTSRDAYPVSADDILLIPTIQRLGQRTVTVTPGEPVSVVTAYRIGNLMLELIEEVGLRSGRAVVKTLYRRPLRPGE